MSLTDLTIKNTTPTDRPMRLTDGRGLYLLIKPSGARWWRHDFRFQGKRKTLSLGVYPDVGLKEARERHAEQRHQLNRGIDPGEVRKLRRDNFQTTHAESFAAVAEEWFLNVRSQWTERHAAYVWRRIEANLLPWLGDSVFSEISPLDVLTTLRRIEDRGAIETAHRVYQYCGKIFRYGVATARIPGDPTRDLRDALKPVQGGHLAALTDPSDVARLLRAIDGYHGSLVVRIGLKLAPLVFVRPGELRQARWDDIDLEKAEWAFHISKTKSEHIVPLSTQALTLLQELRPLTGRGEFVFPANRGKGRPMSENTLRAALMSLGYEGDRMTIHGFRAVARTLLDEALRFPPHLIEHQLAHRVRDSLGRAYNRTKHIEDRRKMMQRWADYLEELKDG